MQEISTDKYIKNVTFKPKVKLWKHQEQAVRKSLNKNFLALFFDPGTGKTATTINILLTKYLIHGGVFPTLILCPLVVVNNWAREFIRYSDIDPETLVVLTGDKDKRKRLFKNAKKNSIFISNYEFAHTPLFTQLEEFFLDRKAEGSPLAVVFDESHKIKSIDAKVTKKAIRIADMCDYRYLLTGTPVLNNVMDIFSQWRALDLGKAFGRNFWTFRKVFFYDKNAAVPRDRYFPDWRVKPDAVETIKRLIDPDAVYAKKSDCLDLPPMIRIIHEVPMGSEQKRLYKSMKEDLLATIKHGEIFKTSIAELAITKALRLQQIVSGHLRVEGPNGPETIKLKDNPRKTFIKELLNGIIDGHKVIVWAVFKSNIVDIKEVCQELNVEFAELHGDIEDKQAEVDRFNNDVNCRVMIGHPQAGGIGVNLTAASYSIFYSRSFSLEFDIQAEARNYRGGSEIHEKITRIDLLTPNTIDEVCYKALAMKQQLSEKMLVSEMTSL